jgi:hypothetical protein
VLVFEFPNFKSLLLVPLLGMFGRVPTSKFSLGIGSGVELQGLFGTAPTPKLPELGLEWSCRAA